jgi:D-mannonate dehydratase
MSDIRNMTQLSRGSNKLVVTMVMQQMEVERWSVESIATNRLTMEDTCISWSTIETHCWRKVIVLDKTIL